MMTDLLLDGALRESTYHRLEHTLYQPPGGTKVGILGADEVRRADGLVEFKRSW